MKNPKPKEEDPWLSGSFEGNRVVQTRDMASRPLIERLRWSCEISEMIRLKALRENKTPPAFDPRRYG